MSSHSPFRSLAPYATVARSDDYPPVWGWVVPALTIGGILYAASRMVLPKNDEDIAREYALRRRR